MWPPAAITRILLVARPTPERLEGYDLSGYVYPKATRWSSDPLICSRKGTPIIISTPPKGILVKAKRSKGLIVISPQLQ